MRAWYQNNSIWQETTSLREALGLRDLNEGCIAVIGAGGKTSAIFQLAEEFAEAGLRVIITTSTRMYREPGTLATSTEEARRLLKNQSIVIAGHPAEDGKIAGLEDAQAKELAHIADILLIEADGSKRLPIKVPAPHEPVIPDGVDIILLLAGLSAIGQRLSQSCHRPELACELLKVSNDHVINPEDIGQMIMKGYVEQRIPAQSNITILLNQADNSVLRETGEDITKLIAPYHCVITQLREG